MGVPVIRFVKHAGRKAASALQCFLREPKRAVAACGLVFGALVVALLVVLITAMFVPTMPLAATVVPLLAWLAGGMLALIGLITAVQLGFDKIAVTLPNGVSITAEDARGRALEGLEKAGEALEPEEP